MLFIQAQCASCHLSSWREYVELTLVSGQKVICYIIAAVAMSLIVFEGHFPIAAFLNATFCMFLHQLTKHNWQSISHSLSHSRASCLSWIWFHRFPLGVFLLLWERAYDDEWHSFLRVVTQRVVSKISRKYRTLTQHNVARPYSFFIHHWTS